jgi:hypothetical protein
VVGQLLTKNLNTVLTTTFNSIHKTRRERSSIIVEGNEGDIKEDSEDLTFNVTEIFLGLGQAFFCSKEGSSFVMD